MTAGRPARVTLRPLAQADLLDCWQYIAEESGPDRATEYLRRIAQKLAHFAEQPYMGRARSDFSPGLRSLPIASHIVFDRPSEGGILVERVFHSRRDVERESF